MNASLFGTYSRASLASIALTGVLTSVHHIFRLGFYPLLVIAVLAILSAPPILMLWFTQTRSKWIARAYSVVVWYIIVFFGFIDGFLDHVLKSLGFQNTTFLPGGDAEVVPTVMSLWSPQAGNIFYEGTGILTAIASFVAAYFVVRFARNSGHSRPLHSKTTKEASALCQSD